MYHEKAKSVRCIRWYKSYGFNDRYKILCVLHPFETEYQQKERKEQKYKETKEEEHEKFIPN